ncbi:MAG: glycine cleavage system protein GcvH [Dehalococcoidia bacterium]|nr:glycine cleavage system protein GcvH [Dehalococcoidia bacterium]
MSNVPNDLKYTKGHSWVKADGDLATVGISDFAQDTLGSILLFELTGEGSTVTQGQPLGTVESDKATSDVISPVSGEIIEINENVTSAPEKANDDPYGEGWLVKVRMSDPDELSNLMSADEFEKFISA